MTLQQALSTALAQGLARIDAQMLLLHVLGRAGHDRAWLITHDTDTLPPATAAQFGALCQRRRAGTPVAYLTGRKAFYGLDLQVDARRRIYWRTTGPPLRPHTDDHGEWHI